MVNKWIRCEKRWIRQILKFWDKIKSLFMIYAHFKSILVPEDNAKQYLEES